MRCQKHRHHRHNRHEERVKSQGGRLAGGDFRKKIQPEPLYFLPRTTLANREKSNAFSPAQRRVKSLGGVQGDLFKGQPCRGVVRRQRGSAHPPRRAQGAFDMKQAVACKCQKCFCVTFDKSNKTRLAPDTSRKGENLCNVQLV